MASLHDRVAEALQAWLHRSPSVHTREAYSRDLVQFVKFAGVDPGRLDTLLAARSSASPASSLGRYQLPEFKRIYPCLGDVSDG